MGNRRKNRQKSQFFRKPRGVDVGKLKSVSLNVDGLNERLYGAKTRLTKDQIMDALEPTFSKEAQILEYSDAVRAVLNAYGVAGGTRGGKTQAMIDHAVEMMKAGNLVYVAARNDEGFWVFDESAVMTPEKWDKLRAYYDRRKAEETSPLIEKGDPETSVYPPFFRKDWLVTHPDVPEGHIGVKQPDGSLKFFPMTDSSEESDRKRDWLADQLNDPLEGEEMADEQTTWTDDAKMLHSAIKNLNRDVKSLTDRMGRMDETVAAHFDKLRKLESHELRLDAHMKRIGELEQALGEEISRVSGYQIDTRINDVWKYFDTVNERMSDQGKNLRKDVRDLHKVVADLRSMCEQRFKVMDEFVNEYPSISRELEDFVTRMTADFDKLVEMHALGTSDEDGPDHMAESYHNDPGDYDAQDAADYERKKIAKKRPATITFEMKDVNLSIPEIENIIKGGMDRAFGRFDLTLRSDDDDEPETENVNHDNDVSSRIEHRKTLDDLYWAFEGDDHPTISRTAYNPSYIELLKRRLSDLDQHEKRLVSDRIGYLNDPNWIPSGFVDALIGYAFRHNRITDLGQAVIDATGIA